MKIFVLIAIIIISLTAPAYAVTDPLEVNIISPTQVIPGTVMKIRVSFINTQEISSPQVQSKNIAEQTRNLSNIIVEEKKVTINDISYENPFQLIEDETTFQQFSIPKSTIAENNEYSRRLFKNKTITQISIPIPKTEKEIVNKELTPVGSALKLRNELQNEFSNRIKTENLSPEQIKSYVELEKKLNKIIQGGRNSIILEIPVPKEFPEGVTLKIPINIAYSTESSPLRTFSATTTVTVTSNPIPKRAIIIDIDGAKRDALYNSLSSMPNTSIIAGYGVKFTNAKTVFPSITLAAQASIFTGNYPGRHNIAGNTWFEKSSLTYRKYSADTWYEDIIWSEGRANEDLNDNVDTVYEAAKRDKNMDSTVVFNHYSRLGDSTVRWIIPGIAEWFYNEFRHEYEKVDSNAMSRTLEELTYYAPPGILTIYLPGLDGYGHYYGPNRVDPYNQEYYFKSYIDEQIGRLLNGDCVDYSITGDCTVYFDGLIGSGLKDETIIVIVADHGQTNVVKDDAHAINKDELEIILKNAGYDIKDIPSESDYDVIAAPNGGMAQIYIRDIDTKNWNDQPELSDLRSALDAFYSQAYVDIILVKYSGSVGYRVYTGSGSTQDLETFFTDRPNYVDAIKRIKGLDAARSGDIILLADYGEGYYYENKPEAGTHGSLNQEDTYIPLVFSGPTIRKGETDTSPTSNIDIAPTIANLLGFSMPEADGVPLDIKNHPPNTPSTPTGSTSGYTSTTYSYSASATDSDGDVIKYLFDWGDGTTSETAHYPSGSIASTSHSWSGSGTYNVKVKAIDGSGASSDWSNSLSVSIITGSSGGPDSFGYTFKDSNAIGGPPYDWIEISGTGTEVLPNSDDDWVENINIGFFFNYYGTDYSRLAISNNGLLFSGVGTWQYVNQPITQTPNVHGFIAPLWDDIVTYGSAGAVYYQILGTAPNRMFVVEWYDNQHYGSSTSGVTFEAVLYEGTNNILFQYKDVDFGTVSGATSRDLPPYNNGGSSTVGIEAPSGDVGLQYSFNEPVITPGLAVLFRFPQYAGVNLYLSKLAPASKDRGSTMTYTLYYHNFADTPAQNVVLEDILPPEVEFVSASDGGSYNPITGKVTWNIGSVAAGGNGYRTVTVRISQSAAIGSIIQNNARISTSNLEVRYDDNEVRAETNITFSTLPPDVSVEPNNGGITPSVVWHAPITFTYYSPCARGAEINIHISDGGPDITGTMVESSPGTWTYTTSFDRKGAAIVTYTVSGCTEFVFFTIYIDPAGYIYDINTGARISGASVWLQHPDGAGGWENVPTGQTPPIAQPDVNPLITGAEGQYQWDVLEGSYRVHVEAQGYYPADSIVVSIPPPVTDLHVGLTRLPDTTPPSSVTNLNATRGSTWLNWTWNNPSDSDLDHIEIYLNSTFLTNISAPQNFHNITALTPDTSYEIGTRTVDTSGNINSSWANATARTLPLDSTPPIITGTLSTAPNAEGWHNSSVTISWSVNDPETGIYSSSGCEPITLSDETPGTTLTCSATNGAGLSSFQSVTARIDKTSPNISISNVTNGSYYNSDVTPVITISDTNLDAQSITLNGASYTSGTVVSAEGSYTLVAYANDMAGNSMTKTVNFVIDKTAPEAAIRFNVISKDIKVYDSETGEEAGYAALPSKNKGDEKGWELRQYTLRDSADNTLLLVLKYKNGKKQAEISVISAQYNGGAVIGEVNNKILVRYVEGSSLKELEQKIEAKKLFAIEAKYKAGKGETEIRTHLEGRREQKETRAGIVILELLTNNGGFIPRY